MKKYILPIILSLPLCLILSGTFWLLFISSKMEINSNNADNWVWLNRIIFSMYAIPIGTILGLFIFPVSIFYIQKKK